MQKFDMDKIIYNRVPKCGSRSMVQIMLALGKKLNFTMERGRPPFLPKQNESGQMQLVDYISGMPSPFLYEKHVHFINFHR